MSIKNDRQVAPVPGNETAKRMKDTLQSLKRTTFARRLRQLQARTASAAPVGGQTHADHRADHAAARRESLELWDEDRRAESVETLRQAISAYGNDNRTWYLYASRLRSVGRPDAALEAVKTAVELQPLDLRGLELLLDLSYGRADSVDFVSRALDTLADRLRDHPEQHLPALGYFVPARNQNGLALLRTSPDLVVRLAAQLNDAAVSTTAAHEILSEAPADQATIAQLLCLLSRGTYSDAGKILQGMPSEAIPAENLRIAIRREIRRGRKATAHNLLIQYLRACPNDSWGKRKLAESQSIPNATLQLAANGYLLPAARKTPAFPVDQQRAFYLLHNSLPYDSAGYATRTHGILKAMRGSGWDVTGLTRLGYPWDRPGRGDLGEIPPVDVVDNVPYERSSVVSSREPKLPIKDYVERYGQILYKKALEARPFVLHGASNHWNGLTAVTVARRLGIASVYEVRGFWEVTRASREPFYGDSDMYRYTARMERDAAAGATEVIAITNALKTELIARGVPEDKISVVPNGVDTARFAPRGRNEELANSLGLSDKKVIGYVGSIVDYEGIDLLIEATDMIARDRDDFAVLVVGDGASLNRMQTLAEERGLSRHIIFTGRVPHSEVEDFYSLIDITPFPRLPLPVCEMVSPLKPMEAMAMGKAIVASDVAALSEMVDHGHTGLLHRKGDVLSLAAALSQLLDNEELRRRLASEAREWVVRERDWLTLAERISEIYRRIGGRPSLGTLDANPTVFSTTDLRQPR